MKTLPILLWVSLFCMGQTELTAKDIGDAKDESGQNLSFYDQWKDYWVTQLSLNLIGYASVSVPFFVLVSYLKRTKYFERARKFAV